VSGERWRENDSGKVVYMSSQHQTSGYVLYLGPCHTVLTKRTVICLTANDVLRSGVASPPLSLETEIEPQYIVLD
jgi:hypothetical protein